MTDAPPPPPPPSGQPASSPPPPPPPSTPMPPRAGVPAGRELAGFWIRFLAQVLDGILYGLLFVPFAIVSTVLIVQAFDDCVTVDGSVECPAGAPEGGSILLGVLVGFVGLVVVVVLYLRALARTGQTWGRGIAGIVVVREDDGAAPGWGKAIGRTLFEQLISPLVFYLGFLWMLWDDRNQTWHDKVAGTLVLRA